MRTRFTELVGCSQPVQLAAMGGGVGGPELAAAVRDAGGLGMVCLGEPVPAACGTNLVVPFVESTAVIADAASCSGIIEFFYGQPDATFVACAHESSAVVGWQVGSGAEAAAAAAAGCDYVVAQGSEAGGHVRGHDPLDVVLPDVLTRVDLPVVAAGGIATPQRVAALLASGADAVRVGTQFLACPESRAHPDYVASLLAATGEDTVLTGWFDLGWPNAPHRVLRSALDAARRSGWRATHPPSRSVARPAADMAQYAGTGVGYVTRIEPAADVLRHLVSHLPDHEQPDR